MIQTVIRALKAQFVFYFPEFEARKQEQLFRQSVENLFQVNNTVRNRSSGEQFKVREVDCGGAMLESLRGHLCTLTWVSPGGKLRTKVPDQWELV